MTYLLIILSDQIVIDRQTDVVRRHWNVPICGGGGRGMLGGIGGGTVGVDVVWLESAIVDLGMASEGGGGGRGPCRPNTYNTLNKYRKQCTTHCQPSTPLEMTNFRPCVCLYAPQHLRLLLKPKANNFHTLSAECYCTGLSEKQHAKYRTEEISLEITFS